MENEQGRPARAPYGVAAAAGDTCKKVAAGGHVVGEVSSDRDTLEGMLDRERFEQLYAEHRCEVERFVRRRLAEPMVEDAVAETFLVAWRRLDDVPLEARPWLFGVSRQVIMTMTRARGRWEALKVRALAEPPIPNASLEVEAAMRTDLQRAWKRLRDSEREVIALAAWDGLSAQEAAQVLGCRPGTYSVRLLRARRRLLHLLEHSSPLTTPWPGVNIGRESRDVQH
ncbi:RNA polymerase sigma factor [Georgenia satyanarayanai]|uniref:RNA polymerase sigma factor n=1 Tax=Georgenia satyanarayanai TaxID=860221 RepID=UPI0020408E83|nr:RNA polymerase sigma factor [Georgenia satyanarayanai]MCM3662610.1 RNA polymerase sigma factor [Georgenia satyanarayanai]